MIKKNFISISFFCLLILLFLIPYVNAAESYTFREDFEDIDKVNQQWTITNCELSSVQYHEGNKSMYINETGWGNIIHTFSKKYPLISLEFYVYFTNLNCSCAICALEPENPEDIEQILKLGYDSSGKIFWYGVDSEGTSHYEEHLTSYSPLPNTWVHFRINLEGDDTNGYGYRVKMDGEEIISFDFPQTEIAKSPRIKTLSFSYFIDKRENFNFFYVDDVYFHNQETTTIDGFPFMSFIIICGIAVPILCLYNKYKKTNH